MKNTNFLTRVLCVSHDAPLLETRSLVLAREHETVQVDSLSKMEALPPQPFDVIVLCHTLSTKECERAARITERRWPNARIVALATPSQSCSDHADATVTTFDGPKKLLRTVDALAHSSVGFQASRVSRS